MKRLFTILAVCAALGMSGTADAKGGASSGGHASSGGRSSSSFSSSSSSKGGFSSSSVSRPSSGYSSPTKTTTVTTRTYSSSYVRSGGYYGGWGAGYHYDNGFMTGLIIGNMMHPTGTIMYAGPGMYANNAVLYPNGQVVNQQGYVVGTYINGVFTPVQNGAMVAQQVPQDAGAQPVNTGPSFGEIAAGIFLGFCIIVACIILFGVLA